MTRFQWSQVGYLGSADGKNQFAISNAQALNTDRGQMERLCVSGQNCHACIKYREDK